MPFSSPPNPQSYAIQVWEIVRKIPAGKVMTYGQIARYINPPPNIEYQDYQAWAPRWVGRAMANCPDDVPWQRVINAQGKISLRSKDAENEQRNLLEEEGIIFDQKGRIDLCIYGWQGITP